MSACRRDTLGDSSTIVLAAVRPSEQLPLIGWRVPSAASSQAPSSGGVLTPKDPTKKRWQTQSVFRGRELLPKWWKFLNARQAAARTFNLFSVSMPSILSL